MKPFRRARAGLLIAVFDDAEVEVLTALTAELSGLLSDSDQADAGGSVLSDTASRARRRLLPDAYAGDAEAAAEFRRFTEADLVARKSLNADVLTKTLAAGSRRRERLEVALDEAETQSWLRSLTDLRLTLATGLGIFEEGDEELVSPENEYALAIYHWLGYVQQSLLEALEA